MGRGVYRKLITTNEEPNKLWSGLYQQHFHTLTCVWYSDLRDVDVHATTEFDVKDTFNIMSSK